MILVYLSREYHVIFNVVKDITTFIIGKCSNYNKCTTPRHIGMRPTHKGPTCVDPISMCLGDMHL
jgi:hypothetical protein